MLYVYVQYSRSKVYGLTGSNPRNKCTSVIKAISGEKYTTTNSIRLLESTSNELPPIPLIFSERVD